MSDRAWALTGWLLIVSGLGRTDYRSKSAKVAVTQRKELAMRRIIGWGENRANNIRWDSLPNPYSSLFSRGAAQMPVCAQESARPLARRAAHYPKG